MGENGKKRMGNGKETRKQGKNVKRKCEKVDEDNEGERTERSVTIEGRQRGKKLHGAKSYVKDTMMCPFF